MAGGAQDTLGKMAVQADVQRFQHALRHAHHILVDQGKDPDGYGKRRHALQGFKDCDSAQSEIADKKAFGMRAHRSGVNMDMMQLPKDCKARGTKATISGCLFSAE